MGGLDHRWGGKVVIGHHHGLLLLLEYVRLAVEGLVVENLHACVHKGVVAGLKMVLSVIEYA